MSCDKLNKLAEAIWPWAVTGYIVAHSCSDATHRAAIDMRVEAIEADAAECRALHKLGPRFMEKQEDGTWMEITR